MTAQELIQKYELTIVIVDGQEMVRCPGRLAAAVKKAGAGSQIKAHKAEIIAILKAREAEAKAAAEARKAKIDAIPGLAEIRAAIADQEEWDEEFERCMETGRSVMSRQRPQYDFAALNARYPQAAAYRKAKALSLKSNYELAAIGRDALEMVINGDWEAALEYIKTENDKFVERHMWD